MAPRGICLWLLFFILNLISTRVVVHAGIVDEELDAWPSALKPIEPTYTTTCDYVSRYLPRSTSLNLIEQACGEDTAYILKHKWLMDSLPLTCIQTVVCVMEMHQPVHVRDRSKSFVVTHIQLTDSWLARALPEGVWTYVKHVEAPLALLTDGISVPLALRFQSIQLSDPLRKMNAMEAQTYVAAFKQVLNHHRGSLKVLKLNMVGSMALDMAVAIRSFAPLLNHLDIYFGAGMEYRTFSDFFAVLGPMAEVKTLALDGLMFGKAINTLSYSLERYFINLQTLQLTNYAPMSKTEAVLLGRQLAALPHFHSLKLSRATLSPMILRELLNENLLGKLKQLSVRRSSLDSALRQSLHGVQISSL